MVFVNITSTYIKEEKVQEPQKPQKFFKRERERMRQKEKERKKADTEKERKKADTEKERKWQRQ